MEKVFVGPLYKVLKNYLLLACDVFDVKMIQIWTSPAAPSTERVPFLAERVAYLRYSIGLRLFNWQVPALVKTQILSDVAGQKLVEQIESDGPIKSGEGASSRRAGSRRPSCSAGRT